jgi:hypothetical protein
MTIIKKYNKNNCCEGVEKRELSLAHHWLKCKLVSSLWKTVWSFLKIIQNSGNDLAIPLLGLYTNG